MRLGDFDASMHPNAYTHAHARAHGAQVARACGGGRGLRERRRRRRPRGGGGGYTISRVSIDRESVADSVGSSPRGEDDKRTRGRRARTRKRAVARRRLRNVAISRPANHARKSLSSPPGIMIFITAANRPESRDPTHSSLETGEAFPDHACLMSRFICASLNSVIMNHFIGVLINRGARLHRSQGGGGRSRRRRAIFGNAERGTVLAFGVRLICIISGKPARAPVERKKERERERQRKKEELGCRCKIAGVASGDRRFAGTSPRSRSPNGRNENQTPGPPKSRMRVVEERRVVVDGDDESGKSGNVKKEK